jgi:hypothetical protein
MSEPEEKEFKNDEVKTPMERIDIIEETLMREDVLGFDPMVLSVLDDSDASQKDIENLKVKLGQDIFNHLFGLANSAYHGTLKMGKVQYFFEVVTRLGMEHTKVAILMFSLHRLARGDAETERIYAKSFAASVLGRILAGEFGFRDESARKAELGCLLSYLGLLMMLVYRNRHQEGDVDIDDDFIQKYQLSLAERILCRFQLPDYFLEMVMTRCFVLDRIGVNMTGVVQIAIAAVEVSFQRFNNRLVIQSPIPSLKENGDSITLGAIIQEQFSAAGLREYLQIVEQQF